MPLGHESSILLIGIGNEFRRDDAAGLFVVRRIQEKKIPGAAAIEHQGGGTDLMECWQGFRDVFIFDAASSGADSGTVHRFEIPPDRVPRDLWGCSTHTLNIADTLELAGALKRLPKRIVLYGIEGASFEKGEGVSAQVKEAVGKVAEEAASEILGEFPSTCGRGKGRGTLTETPPPEPSPPEARLAKGGPQGGGNCGGE